MMQKRKKVRLVLGAILLVFLATGFIWRWQNAAPKKPDSIPPGDYTYTVAYAEHRIHQLMKQRHLPSVAVALIDDQDIVWQEAFGMANVEKEVPATVDTVYKLWSLSKAFIAIETMRLVEEGLVDLDAPITDYLPDFSIQSRFPDSEPITIRSILAHHSGLPRNGCHRVTYRPADDAILGKLVASLPDCHQTFPVGSRYKYSNIGSDTAGYIVQEMRGVSFARYMKENLLAPIGMDNSAFVSSGVPAEKVFAPGYEYYEGEYYSYKQADIANLPSSGLYSTIADMSDFVRFVLRGGEANGEQIVNPETFMLMYADQYSSPRDPQLMGLGWKLSRVFGSELMVWHDGGAAEGTGSLVALLPERKLGVVLLANEVSFDGGMSVPLAGEILELMLETKYGVLPPGEDLPKPVEVEPGRLEDFVGKYIVFGEEMDVFVRGERLKGSVQGMNVDLVPVSQTRFLISHWLLKLGLADLLQLPMDLRELRIEFLVGDDTQEDIMIVKLGDIFYEVFPKYSEVTEIPPLWEELAGEYELSYRLPSGKAGGEVVGRSEITIEDNVLKMAGLVGPLQPINETEIVILSGPFAGETMVYEPGTGNIYHQSIVFRPSEPDLKR